MKCKISEIDDEKMETHDRDLQNVEMVTHDRDHDNQVIENIDGGVM